ncbi:MAG: hypothetical protein K8F92_07715 [Hyphomicrobium sp.]|uniref:hypothetical protein n=1 Tax=Hyphomicrobium sp. TaxID=82 RepID=UPI0013205DBE|nr:hypothetical protein [Hyphomicrobium sp.]KAB2939247.1 MAG: hypothetical protein F9K20_17875 [Hyphomicrobium sp.]MBZ0209526.1 hypothetical protein [Hyphomicrobium sp.]
MLSREILQRSLPPWHETINWADNAQAEDYRGLLLSYISPVDIIVIGGKRIKEMPQVPDGGTIRMLTYAELVSQAESELQWLLRELSRDSDKS